MNEQWLNNALIAIVPIERSSNPLSKFGLLALPVGATTPQYIQVNFRNMTFTFEQHAEGWIGRNLPKTVRIVKPEDLTEEIERRSAYASEEACYKCGKPVKNPVYGPKHEETTQTAPYHQSCLKERADDWERQNNQQSLRDYPPREVTEIERLSWGL